MSTYYRILLGLVAAAYLISPIDIIPDLFVPYLGWLDDTFIIGVILYYIKNGRLPDYFHKRTKGAFYSESRNFKSTDQGSAKSSTYSKSSEYSKQQHTSAKQYTSEKARANFSSNNSQSDPGAQRHSSQSSSQTASQKPDQENLKKSPHEILGISHGASKDEILAAYRKGVKQYHPDRVAHLGKDLQELANKKFIEIKEAYNTLMKIS